MIIREVSFIVNQKRYKMIVETKKIKLRDEVELNIHIVENGSPVWIVVTHGLAEHAGRHNYFHKIFSQYFNICTYDLRGHGNSSGKRVHVESFNDFVVDLEEVVGFLQDNYSMKRYINFGHSMGGLVVSSFMQNLVREDNYPEKVFLSGPATAGTGVLGNLFAMAPMKIMKSLSNLPVSATLGGMIDISKLSHDPRVYESYISDELCSLKVHSKLFLEILHESRKVFSRPLRIKCDLFCAVGTGDVVVDSATTIKYFKTMEKNAKLLIVKGGYHELHNEIEKYRDEYLNFLKESIMDTIYE
jgi:acylglycerol lipase